MMGDDGVTRTVAAWSHLVERGGIEATTAAFPDLVSVTGDLDRDVLELYVAELEARADAARARVEEEAAAASFARVEYAVVAILRTCERLRDVRALTASELELAAVVVAVLSGLEEES